MFLSVPLQGMEDINKNNKNTRTQVTKNPLHFVDRDMNLFAVDGCSRPGLDTPGGIWTAELCHGWIFHFALLSPDSPCQLDVLRLKGYMAAMQHDQIGVFEETNQVCFSRTMEGREHVSGDPEPRFVPFVGLFLDNILDKPAMNMYLQLSRMVETVENTHTRNPCTNVSIMVENC